MIDNLSAASLPEGDLITGGSFRCPKLTSQSWLFPINHGTNSVGGNVQRPNCTLDPSQHELIGAILSELRITDQPRKGRHSGRTVILKEIVITDY